MRCCKSCVVTISVHAQPLTYHYSSANQNQPKPKREKKERDLVEVLDEGHDMGGLAFGTGGFGPSLGNEFRGEDGLVQPVLEDR